MKKKEKRVPTQIHTRELDRMVAKNNMKKAGFMQICKKDRTGESIFKRNWKQFVNS